MIDIRCHVLDGTNCGPQSFAESLEMCRLAAASGVRAIVATLSWEAGTNVPPLPLDECQQRLARLQAEVNSQLALKLGFVMRFSSSLPVLVDQYGSNLTLGGGRHLLVSLPSLQTPAEVEEVWSQLGERGFSVIVAHPECSPALRRSRARLERWIASGVMVQIDAASVVGAHGRDAERFAAEFIQKYPQHLLVASNAHDVASAKRSSFLAARRELVKRLGARQAQSLLDHRPTEILQASDEKINRASKPAARRSLTTMLRSLKPTKMSTDAS